MAHAYKNFPTNGPLDALGRPLGKCDCGRWEDSVQDAGSCPNAPGAPAPPSNFSFNH